MTYANKTTVSPERTRGEIEATLNRYGADAFAYATEAGRAMVQFRVSGRHVKITLPLPLIDDHEIMHTNNGRLRPRGQRANYHAQLIRSRWRALLLTIKAKLESIEAGIETFDEAFMSWIMLPDGTTVGERVTTQIAESYESGDMPKLLTTGS